MRYIDKTNENESTFDNLLSSILKYDKSFNKSKRGCEKKNTIKKISSKKFRITKPKWIILQIYIKLNHFFFYMK